MSDSSRPRRLTLFVDRLAVAAEAIAFGSTSEAYWQTLMSFAERESLDALAQRLACLPGARGPTREWWRCTLLLGTNLPLDQALELARTLDRIEAEGGGPTYDRDRHVLFVTRAIERLREHLRSVLQGSVSMEEVWGVEEVIRAVRRVRGGA